MNEVYQGYFELSREIRSLMSTYIAYVELAETLKKFEVIHDYFRLKSGKVLKRIELKLEG